MFLKYSKKLSLCALILFVNFPHLKAQNQTDNMGKEFLFSFLETHLPTVKVSFSISCRTAPNTIAIDAYPIPTLYFTIYRKDTVISFTSAAVTPNASNFINTNLRISSIKDISVYALNSSTKSSDIATVVPINNIPYNPHYYINSFKGDRGSGGNNSSEFSILAIDDSCYINIIPSADVTTFGGSINTSDQKDSTIYRLLRRNQLIYLQTTDSQSLAGSKIWNNKGCKRFVVFEGCKASRILTSDPTCSGVDHLFNQSRPIELQGKAYTTLPFQGLAKGYIVQIVAAENNTSLFIDGSFIKIMNEREVYMYNNTNNSSNCIRADKNISVVQLMKSGICNGSLIGNPCLMTVLPDDQLTQNVQFIAPTTIELSSSPAEFYIGLTCPKQNLKSIFINNLPIDSTKATITCNNNAFINIKILALTAYTIESSKGFLAYLYANGNNESYATELGGAFELNKAKLSVEPASNFSCDTFHTFTFKATSDSLAVYFWKFGDGSTQNGDSIVNKVYNKTGTFKLNLFVNYLNSDGCKADTFEKSITIFSRPYFTLGKDTSLCSGDYYTLAPFARPKSKFLWQNSSQYRSFNASNSGLFYLTVTDSNKCTYTDSINLKFINCDTNSIKIPNVFTPGTLDELNDYLEAEFTGYDKLTGIIYNRWGVVVYRFNYPEDSYWDGNLHNQVGSPCPAGTYYYIYKFTNSKINLIKEVNGTVQLIR